MEEVVGIIIVVVLSPIILLLAVYLLSWILYPFIELFMFVFMNNTKTKMDRYFLLKKYRKVLNEYRKNRDRLNYISNKIREPNDRWNRFNNIDGLTHANYNKEMQKLSTEIYTQMKTIEEFKEKELLIKKEKEEYVEQIKRNNEIAKPLPYYNEVMAILLLVIGLLALYTLAFGKN